MEKKELKEVEIMETNENPSFESINYSGEISCRKHPKKKRFNIDDLIERDDRKREDLERIEKMKDELIRKLTNELSDARKIITSKDLEINSLNEKLIGAMERENEYLNQLRDLQKQLY